MPTSPEPSDPAARPKLEVTAKGASRVSDIDVRRGDAKVDADQQSVIRGLSVGGGRSKTPWWRSGQAIGIYVALVLAAIGVAKAYAIHHVHGSDVSAQQR